MDSEFDKIEVCVHCEAREYCDQHPEVMYCEDIKRAYDRSKLADVKGD
jgi:hypothetical protein